jgi:hypothetical protein
MAWLTLHVYIDDITTLATLSDTGLPYFAVVTVVIVSYGTD